MRVSIGVSTLAVSLVVVSGGPVLADDRGEGMRDSQLSASLMGGVGAQLADRDDGALGPGMGLRAGYTIDKHMYLGGQALLFGTRFDTLSDVSDGPAVETRLTDGFAVGVEGGYAQQLGPVILRPSVVLGLGLLAYAGSSSNAAALESSHPGLVPAMYVAPGASLLVPIGSFFAGIDPRFVYLLGEQSHSTVSLMGMLGATL